MLRIRANHDHGFKSWLLHYSRKHFNESGRCSVNNWPISNKGKKKHKKNQFKQQMHLWTDLDENAFCQRPSDPLPNCTSNSLCDVSFEPWENKWNPKESSSNFLFVTKCHDRSLQFVSLKAKKMQWSFIMFRSKIEWRTKERGKERKIIIMRKKMKPLQVCKYQKECEMHNNNSQ